MHHPWNRKRVVLAMLMAIASASPVVADGKIFSLDAVQTPVAVPDQQALISYADGVETLVIETRFVGQGEQFAWVVPLPALPEVSAASPSIFPTLRSVFRPMVIDDVVPWSLMALAVTLVATPVLFRRYALGLLLLLLLFILPSLLMTAGLQSPSVTDDDVPSSVTVHARQMIGDYDVATLSADRPDTLIVWLKQNHFSFDDRDKAVIADYVKEKWFFVAVKLDRKADTKDAASPHPLAFKFPTKQPIYPLRLTATHNGPCTIDLYVFGPGRASIDIPAFQTVQCGWTERPGSMADLRFWQKQDEKHIAIVHSKLQPLVPASTIATKLSGTLTSSNMTRDAIISWEPFQVLQPEFYSVGAVRTIALNTVVIIQCLAYLVLLSRITSKRVSPKRAAAIWLVLLAIVTPVAYAGYTWWPKTDMKSPRKAAATNRFIQTYLIPRLIFDIESAKAVLDPDRLRKGFDQLVHDPKPPAKALWFKNNFTGELRREEESPGNYGFRQREDGVEYLWYDADGGEHIFTFHTSVTRGSGAPATAPATDPSGQ